MHRRTLLTRLFTAAGLLPLLPQAAFGMGEDALTLGVITWGEGSGWNLRPSALRRMLQEVEKRTNVAIKAKAVPVALDKGLFEYPLVFLTGAKAIDPWTASEQQTLKTYLEGGGMMIVDSSEGVSDGPFLTSVRRELERVFGPGKIAALPPEHVIYKSFYLLDKPYGRAMVSGQMQALMGGDRALVVLSANDLLGAWARDGFGRWEYDVVPGAERQRELSFRLGINLVMYALCVNYKADQVHIPFILKRRQWRVD